MKRADSHRQGWSVFLAGLLMISLAGCTDSGSGTAGSIQGYPIDSSVVTTASRQVLPVGLSAADTPQISPKDISLYETYGYSGWRFGVGLPHVKRSDLAPGLGTSNASRLLSFFAITDIHITDKESPAQVNWVGWNAPFGAPLSSAYSPVILATTQVLDAAVQTINALHRQTPFDFGISLGDTINNAQYNEVRWYIDVLDGKVIVPSSGAHAGADTIDYQKPFQAAGLNREIPWYQVIGNHDQFFLGTFYEFDKTLAAHVGSEVMKCSSSCPPTYAGIRETGFYMGVVDGTTPYGDIIKTGPETDFPAPLTVVPDPDRRSLASAASPSLEYIAEFFKTTSTPAGHGFNLVDPARGADFACYSFQPKAEIPIKVIALDDTCKGGPVDQTTNYAAGCLDQTRIDWLKAELQEGQDNDKLMIIAAHIPVHPQTKLVDDGTHMPVFRSPTDGALVSILHNYPNLLLWISGHRHVNVVSPQPFNAADLTDTPEKSFWVVETSSLRDFPQQFRTFDIRRNSDNTVSIIVTNVDPAVRAGSPAAKSRGYAVGASRLFGIYPLSDTGSQAYNAELVKQLTPAMQAVIAPLGSPL